MKRLALFMIIILIWHPEADAQDNKRLSDSITSKLKAYLVTHKTEKAYLHFDKPYYASGDTIYFKGYVTTAERHELSMMSGVLHVDLINPRNKIEKSTMLPLVNGIAWGDFALPDTLSAGTYRIRAWTRLMRNAGDDSFFEKQVRIGSLQSSKIPESATLISKEKADIQFLPEGGELVSGINSRVAFKAISSNGKGMAVNGVISDNTGREVTRFGSTHLGMGSFALQPEPGKNYSATIRYADGSQTIASMPKAREEGITLAVNNDSIAKATVSIHTSLNYFASNKDKEFELVIWSGDKMTTVPFLLDSSLIRMDVLKRRLQTGVTTITLFSPENEPLAERLIFVQNYDQLNVNVQADKDIYGKREKVKLKLNIKDRADNTATGHFSVSVTDENKVPTDENEETTILSELLLSSDLKGTIEQPNYYFHIITDQTQRELDLVMLTHGYRRFKWKEVVDKDVNGNNKVVYQPETGLEISGTASSLLLGKPLAVATVSLISPTGGPILSQITDEKGNFHFSNLMFLDTTRFVLQAVTAKGKNTTKLAYNEERTPSINSIPSQSKTDTSRSMHTYLQNVELQQEELNRLGLGKGKMLKEVKIKARKKDDSDGNYRSSSLVGPGYADEVIHAEQIEKFGGKLSDRLTAIARRGFGGLVYIDGVKSSLDNVSPIDVETVEILLGANAAIYGPGSVRAGVVVITTKAGKNISVVSTGILPITPKGFYKAREFYSPKYTSTDQANDHKDLRTTIFWQPDLRSDKDGNASFEHYNADGTGSYRVVIEGIDEKGNIARHIYRYKVK